MMTVLIAELNSGLIVQSSQLSFGQVNSISAVFGTSNIVQAVSSYSITFAPIHILQTLLNSAIQLQFPTAISLIITSPCKVQVPSGTLFGSAVIQCTFLDAQNVLISQPFNSQYSGGQPLTLTISSGVNPLSEEYAGAFIITTYNVIGGVNYIVDQGTSAGTLLQPVIGSLKQSSVTVVQQPITYTKDQNYTFTIQFQHVIPSGGYLIIVLPQEGSILISNPALVTNYCMAPDLNNASLVCSTVNSSAIRVNIGSSTFPNGVASMSTHQIKFGGLWNPRSELTTGSFSLTSFDTNGYRIDASKIGDFTVQMTQSTNLTVFIATPSNYTNGLLCSYRITLTSPTPIQLNDVLQITFPVETQLQNGVYCQFLSPSYIPSSAINCSNTGTQILKISFSQLTQPIIANTQIQFNVSYVKNPGSTQLSSSFTNIFLSSLVSTQLYEVARYRLTNVVVQTNNPQQLGSLSLTQSTLVSQSQAIYTITFSTVNPIPNTGVILIQAPNTITLVRSSSSCLVTVLNVIEMNKCQVTQQSITVSKAFNTSQGFNGTVQVQFLANNPLTNLNPLSFTVGTYTDLTFHYIIDMTNIGLVPTLNCNYPCQSCSATDPDFCTNCYSGDLMPEYIQQNPTNQSQQTCLQGCNTGYTTDGTINPLTCTACNPECSTCAQNGLVGDIAKCVTCSSSFPYFYSNLKTCLNKCMDGTYICNKFQCCDCHFPCQTCASATSCKTCFTNSSQPLLYGDQCISSCPAGQTQVGYNCVKCQSPCTTCDVGKTSSCLACDGSSGRQFLFGRECVSTCPIGTIAQISNTTQSYCQGCEQGCNLCNLDDNSICLTCSLGLSLFNNTCFTECPFNYVATGGQGSICQLRQQLLASSLVYFPFACAGVAMIALCITSYIITGRKSLIISNAIALLSLVEVGALFLQLYQSYIYQRNYMIITVGTFAVLMSHSGLNMIFMLFYCLKLQFSDPGFNFWRKRHICALSMTLIISFLVSFKLFRLIYSRLFGFSWTSAQIEEKQLFVRRIQVFGFVSIFLFSLPLIVFDVIILYYLEWGSQLYITCAESGGIAFIIAVLTICDNCCKCSRLSYIDEMELLQARQSPEKYRPIGEDDESKREESKKERFQREEILRGLIATVMYNRDLQIQDERTNTDQSEFGPIIRRTASFNDLVRDTPEELMGEDLRRTASFHYGDGGRMRGEKHKQETSPLPHHKHHDQGAAHSMFNYNNVYAETMDLPQLTRMVHEDMDAMDQIDIDVQTDQPDVYGVNRTVRRKDRQLDDEIQFPDVSVDSDIDGVEEFHHIKDKKTQIQKKRGKDAKNYFFTQVDSESVMDLSDDLSALNNDQSSNVLLKTAYMDHINKESNIIHRSKTQKPRKTDDRNISNLLEASSSTLKGSKKSGVESRGMMKPSKPGPSSSPFKTKNSPSAKKSTISLTKQAFSSKKSLQTSSAKSISDAQSEPVKSVIVNDDHEYFNQRTFNINDIMGDFESGTQFEDDGPDILDLHDRLANSRGYLIVSSTQRSVYNKYNFNIMFSSSQMTQEEDIPMPYRLECMNFNPHEIIGRFDYDLQSEKPIILKSKKTGKLVDKNLRSVNQYGFLIDEGGSIIDNQGRVRVAQTHLRENGDFPLLLNYDGKAFDIRNVIGIFDKENDTKQIIHITKGVSLNDKLGRRVNSSGYLSDERGNIVYRGGTKIVFPQKCLMFNEPPKIFDFIKFDVDDIRAGIEMFPIKKPMPDDLNISISDEDANNDILVNARGYRTDRLGNIIDSKSGGIVFRREILDYVTDGKGKSVQAEIPFVFRIPENLMQPPKTEIVKKVHQEKKQENTNHVMIDAQEYLQSQLERIQGRVQFEQRPEIEPNAPIDFTILNDVHEEEEEQSPVMKMKENSLSESELRKEIYMFNQVPDQEIVDISKLPGYSLLNERPALNDDTQVISKKKRQPSQQRLGHKILKASQRDPRLVSQYLPIPTHQRSHSNLNFNERRRQIAGGIQESALNKTGVVLIPQIQHEALHNLKTSTQDLTKVLNSRKVLRNKFMQSSHNSSRSSQDPNRKEGQRTSNLGMRIMNADESQQQLGEIDGFDEEDSVFDNGFNKSNARKSLSNPRSKSQQRINRLKMYEAESMIDMFQFSSNLGGRRAESGLGNSKQQESKYDSKIQNLQNIYLMANLDQMKRQYGGVNKALSNTQSRVQLLDNRNVKIDYQMMDDESQNHASQGHLDLGLYGRRNGQN